MTWHYEGSSLSNSYLTLQIHTSSGSDIALNLDFPFRSREIRQVIHSVVNGLTPQRHLAQ